MLAEIRVCLFGIPLKVITHSNILPFPIEIRHPRKEKGNILNFYFLFSVALVVLGLRLNQAEPPYEKPNQLNRREFVD